MFQRNVLFLTLIGLCLSCTKPVNEILVSSPNGNHQLLFKLSTKGEPLYQINSNGKKVITPSKLGVAFVNQDSLNSGFELLGVEKNSVDTTWNQSWGEFEFIRDHHNELIVHLKETDKKHRLLNIVFRAFNDGIGFRYEFPEQPELKEVQILDEFTEFNFPEDQKIWWIPVHSENSYYESFYRKTPMSETDTINTPATIETNDSLFVAIHEANLTDFASMTLKNTGGSHFKSELVPWSNGVKVYASTPFVSPWRTLIIGEKPGDLVTSTLMLNLNEPSKIDDLSWIRPSKYIGIWWGMHLEKFTWGQGEKHGATTENTKKYIDFAAENGFDGVLVEGWNQGWDGDWTADGNAFSFVKPYPDFDLEEIGKYAVQKNVRLIGHHETAGAAKHYEDEMEDAFKLYHKNGVNTVKTGYVNKYLDKKEWHDSQYGVRHYRKVVETAAKYHIMIDNHEPVKGTGLQRTYPNLMTQEGGRGQEYNAWSPDGGNTPEHTTIVPFTRMLSGPFDFTPGNFNFDYETPNGAMVNTTVAKQLALYVVIFSPLQMASDLPENYRDRPAFEFIKNVPVSWSDTKVLNAQIGKYVTMVRKDRKSEDWYLGSITNKEARNMDISCNFLDKGNTYEATIYTDGEGANYKDNPYPVGITKRKVASKDTINIHLAPGGGTAIAFKALKE
ncbi:glycoside hydrolase family 97 protein [Galbibacter pacificus]|uniref:Glycoside hydrolase family 97 protein n=1 Tax=Galbibacter pacificus TaxID=2996052 RepID=A0ABT6FMX1_9FLAO|nr:glycoside hydrolase family 97 protein [Galbibacter pacificus]MDG3581136.1 glycoside hydrolase family 97 protein [Galbibacter pacificus]MDG3584614.1 glycoside hydrolase family 97 protein [Galbibacter pacificus]